MSFWERAWATFVSDPTTVIGIGLLRCRLVFRGFLHKERVQILNDQLSQARRDADTFTAKFVRAEAQFTEYRNQVAQRAPPAQIEATANSTAVLLGDLKAANTTLQQTLNPESGRFGFAGRESRRNTTFRVGGK